RLLSLRRKVERDRVPFYPESEPTAARRQPPGTCDGPGWNRVRAAVAAGCECNRADALRPQPGDRGRSIPPGGPTPAVHEQARHDAPTVRGGRMSCVLRSDIHEGAAVKAGARRVRDFPDIHSASPAAAGRHERYAVAPIHTGGVAMRHVGPRDAT